MARKLPVKWFNYDLMSGAGGAPELNGLSGSLINVLDACLINGFNTRSVVSFEIEDEVGTIEFGASGHGFVLHQVVAIGGATDDQYNGDWRVTAVNTTSIEVDARGVADVTVAGTLSCKTAPVGDWEKAFSGTNKAAYRSTHPDATGCLLRVDDTVGAHANVRGYETMTDIDTGAGPFPTTAQRATSVWRKSDGNNSNIKHWVLVADGLLFYFMPRPNNQAYTNAQLHCFFGDIVSYKPADLYHAVIATSDSTTSSGGFTSQTLLVLLGSNAKNFYIARSYTQVGSSTECGFMAAVNSTGFTGNDSLPTYPSPLDNSLILSDLKLVYENSQHIRGRMPGFLSCHQQAPLNHGDLVEDALGAGRHVILIGGSTGATSGIFYRYALDIIGGWR